MAEVPDFDNKNPDLDKKFDCDDEEQELNRTESFDLYKVSTPYNRGKQIEMQTMLHEQTGPPGTSYEETPLLSLQAERETSWDNLTKVFPEASATDLETQYNKGRLQVKMAGFGRKLYFLFTKEKGTDRQHLNPQLTEEIETSLGPMAQEIVDREDAEIRADRQNLRDAEKQLKRAKTIEAEKEKASQEMQKIERTQAKIDDHQAEHGTNLENEAEISTMNKMLKNYQEDFEI